MKIINYYEPRAEELLEPMPGGITHIAKMYVEANINGKNQILNYGAESWGKSKEDAEMTAREDFIDWANENGFSFKK